MSLCQCQEGPRCELYHCTERADWTAMMPLTWKPPLRLGPKFACNQCWEYFKQAWNAPIKGIDRPVGADEDWQPSLFEMMRHAEIAIAFSGRDKQHVPMQLSLSRHGDAERFTPAQHQQVMMLRKHMRDYPRV